MWGGLIELATVGMQGHKQAYFDIELFGPFQQGIGGTSEEFIEQGPGVGKGGPEFVGHSEGDVLPFTIGQDVLLLSNLLFGGFHVTGAAAFAFTTLAVVFGMRAEAQQYWRTPIAPVLQVSIRSTTSLVHSGTTLPCLVSNCPQPS